MTGDDGGQDPSEGPLPNQTMTSDGVVTSRGTLWWEDYRSSDVNMPAPRRELFLLGLFPFNGSWAGGLGQLPAVQMGLEDVNRDQHILPGYRLSLTVNNTGVSRPFVIETCSSYLEFSILLLLGYKGAHTHTATSVNRTSYMIVYQEIQIMKITYHFRE